MLVLAGEVDDDGAVQLGDGRARHIIDVLGAAPGDRVRIGVIDGPLGTGTVMAASGDQVELRCAFDAPPPRPAVDLLLALPRPKVLRRLWAQLAALGVGQILLTNAARVERNYFDTHVLDEAVYRPLLIEGLQQARDTWLPRVSVRRQLKVLVEDALDALVPEAARVVAHPGAASSITAVVRQAAARRVLLAVGPEGGWTPYELDLLGAHGFQAVSTGTRTLRSDTACVALLALAHEGLRERPE